MALMILIWIVQLKLKPHIADEMRKYTLFKGKTTKSKEFFILSNHVRAKRKMLIPFVY
jgi:hypothetical protein